MNLSPKFLSSAWNKFLCLFTPKPSVLVLHLSELIGLHPELFEASLGRYGNIPTVRIQIADGSGLSEAGNTVICVQKEGFFLDHPAFGVIQMNRREVRVMTDAITEWSKT